MSNIVIKPSPAASLTAHTANAPFKTVFFWGTGQSASSSDVNKVLIPNAQTRKVMAETETGINVVNFDSLDEMFKQLDS
jgi:hypothetical protein